LLDVFIVVPRDVIGIRFVPPRRDGNHARLCGKSAITAGVPRRLGRAVGLALGRQHPVKRFGGIERVERRRVVAPAGVAMRQQASGEPLLEGDDERWTSPSAILRVLPNTDSYATTASMAGSRANLRL
jgi:hypothetical protein